MQKSAGDISYLQEHPEDVADAATVMQTISPKTVLHDIYATLNPDKLIKDYYFDGINALLLSGEETEAFWQSELNKEASRLNLPVEYAPRGDWLAVHSCPHYLIDIFERYGKPQAKREIF